MEIRTWVAPLTYEISRLVFPFRFRFSSSAWQDRSKLRCSNVLSFTIRKPVGNWTPFFTEAFKLFKSKTNLLADSHATFYLRISNSLRKLILSASNSIICVDSCFRSFFNSLNDWAVCTNERFLFADKKSLRIVSRAAIVSLLDRRVEELVNNKKKKVVENWLVQLSGVPVVSLWII